MEKQVAHFTEIMKDKTVLKWVIIQNYKTHKMVINIGFVVYIQEEDTPTVLYESLQSIV